jgi:hypothetical protein
MAGLETCFGFIAHESLTKEIGASRKISFFDGDQNFGLAIG